MKKHYPWIIILAIALIASSSGCSLFSQEHQQNITNVLTAANSALPQITAMRCDGAVVELEFSCLVTATVKDVTVEGKRPRAVHAHDDKPILQIWLHNELTSGKSTQIAFTVKNAHGSSASFTASLWGKNKRIPKIVISEFSTKGTEANPERVELKILSDGNLEGLTVFDGSPSFYNNSIILPNLEVYNGDYIVISWRGNHMQQTESLSGPRVFYLNSENGTGLPSNNGSITITENPMQGSSIIDCVLYSCTTTKTYKGFGSQFVLNQAEELHALGAWTCFSGCSEMSSHCAIDGTNSTATRSLNRTLESIALHSHSALDWYVVPTKGSTFGGENSTDRFKN